MNLAELKNEDLKLLAMKYLNEAIDNYKDRICVGYVSSSPLISELGSVSYIQICEHKIYSDKDFNRWQERIQIVPKNKQKVKYIINGNYRDIKDVYEDLKKVDLNVSVCVKILEKIDDKKYLAKLFDKYLLIVTKLNLKYDLNKKYKHQWINLDIDNVTLFEIKDKKTLMSIAMKYSLR